MSNVVISFIVPVYNVEKYLETCLDSILLQNAKNIEIICIEDCSTDCSREILQRYCARHDQVMVLQNKSNCGLSSCRNRGLKAASGRYIHFVDSDDYVSTNLIDELKNDFYNDEIDIISFNFYNVFENTGEIIKRPIEYRETIEKIIVTEAERAKLITSNSLNISVSSRIYRREFLLNNQLAFIEGIYYEDIPFTLKSLMLSKSIKIVDAEYYYYRRRDESITTMPSNLSHLEGVFRGYLSSLNFLSTIVLTREMSISVTSYLNKYFLLWINEFVLNNRLLDIQFTDRILQHQWKHFDYNLNPPIFNKAIWHEFKDVVIYGTGLYSRRVFSHLLKSDINVLGFVETEQPSKNSFLTHTLKTINEYQDVGRQLLVVIATSAKFYDEIIQNLIRLGFENYITYDEILDDSDTKD